jgi:regulator of sigma E protease
MGDALVYIISTVIVLGIMILVHEWGHFVMARVFGVRVDIFSIGFGPRLWGRKRGDTDYRISALPLGGYVKMAGDNPSEERANSPDEFLSKPRWQRAVIALAGPAMNIVMAALILAALFMIKGEGKPKYYGEAADIAAVAQKSTAEMAGLRAGDRIVDINGVAVATWLQAYQRLDALLPKDDVSLTVARDGNERPVELQTKAPFELGDVLGYPRDPVFIEAPAPGMPASAAGLKAGDQIVAINGTPLVAWMQCVSLIRHSNGETLQFEVKRGEDTLQLAVKPVLSRVEQGRTTWQVGLANRPILVYERLAPVAALSHSVARTWDFSALIVTTVAQLFMGKVALREMGGVIEISYQAGQAFKRGPVDLVQLMVGISLNLGILNLLPIPILDGGHLLMLAIEGVRRRDLSLAVRERFVQVGLVFLLVVFAIVMYNDVLKRITHR